MGLLLFLGILMVGLALLLAKMATETTPSEQTGISRSLAALEAMGEMPKELTAEYDRPFGERVLEPLQGRALAIGRRLSGADSNERLYRKLELAGNPAGWRRAKTAKPGRR